MTTDTVVARKAKTEPPRKRRFCELCGKEKPDACLPVDLTVRDGMLDGRGRLKEEYRLGA